MAPGGVLEGREVGKGEEEGVAAAAIEKVESYGWISCFALSLDDCRRQRGHGNEQAEVATGEGGTAQCRRCQATEKGDRLNKVS